VLCCPVFCDVYCLVSCRVQCIVLYCAVCSCIIFSILILLRNNLLKIIKKNIPLGEWIWGTKIPVGAVWKLLPWNKGRAASCNIKCKYVDNDFRVMEDNDKELFVYTRPVCSRPQ
jgi:hypothetical protein